MMRILVVDDEVANFEVVEGVLRNDPYELMHALSAEMALEKVAQRVPDLFLLDLQLPGISGLKLLKELKSRPDTRLVPAVMITAHTDRAFRLQALESGADDFLSKPVDAIELRARVRALLRLKAHIDQLEEAENVLLAFGRTVEARDPGTGEHCDRMMLLVDALSAALNLDQHQRLALRRSAYLHDVGKIAVSDSVLLKPSRLNAAEWAMMKVHPTVGEEILRPLSTFQDVLPLVRSHHERLDGSGYPDGLKGEQIPLAVRILSVADVYDALTVDRPYREAMSPTQALAVIQEETARGWWDPVVVGALSKHVVQDGRRRAL